MKSNAQWRAAEEVRRQHVRDWLATTKQPTAAMTRWMLDEMLAGIDMRSLAWKLSELRWAGNALISTQVCEGDDRCLVSAAPSLSAARATQASLALVLAVCELDTGVEDWRHPVPGGRTARYLAFLAAHTGYKLGEVEQLAAGQTA
jgi:hypothetical protein